jgi:hypothetical protein
MSDLVIEALREGIDPYDIPTAEKIMDMAAAEIERLTERRDSLAASVASYAVENELLAAQIEPLRAALTQIIDRAEYRMGSKVSDDVVAIAKAALEQSARSPR